MATADLNLTNETFDDGLETVLIRRKGGRIIGGRTLNMTGFTEDKVKGGHIIIKSKTDNYDLRPLPVSNGAFGALAEGFEYAGILVRTATAKDPRAAIQYDGEINDLAMPYPLTDALRAALKTALPSLHFDHD